jgi:beta-barrel assembly-enhancing protease
VSFSFIKRDFWALVIAGTVVCYSAPARSQNMPCGACRATDKPQEHHFRRVRPRDDIDAIGVRNIRGRKIGNWYSPEREAQIGKQYSDAIEHNSELIRDSMVNEYVNRIGQNLVRNSDARVPFTIKVIASEEVNAYALPGAYLYVNSGLLLFVDNEAELAAVMAHEIAHVAARHATRQMTRSHLFSMASVPLVFVTGGAGLVLQEAMDIATPLGNHKLSRGFEAEADYLGLEYAYKAGYDPQAFVSFFERVQRSERQKPNIIVRAFSTHPATSGRVRKLQAEIANILPPRPAYVVSTSDFDMVKSHLNDLENGPQRKAAEYPGQPTLKRRTSPAPDAAKKENDVTDQTWHK